MIANQQPFLLPAAQNLDICISVKVYFLICFYIVIFIFSHYLNLAQSYLNVVNRKICG